MKVTIIPDTLPRTWQEILNAFSPAEVRSFPMRGQALINVRHVIARMHGGSGKFVPHSVQRRTVLYHLHRRP